MKYVWLVLFMFMVSGCQIINIAQDEMFSDQLSDIPLYYGDFSEVETLSDIPRYMKARVTYKVTASIKTPEEILDSGKCDCDGFALLYMNIAYIRFGIKPSICLVDNSRKIVDGGSIDHAIVKVNGVYRHAQNGREYHGSIGYEYSFDEVFEH